MENARPRKAGYLALDKLAANPRVARRLPADLACRFHALPVAEDNGRVTVVMADPDDAAARDAVTSALGMASCLVQGDPAAIDALLAEIWNAEAGRSLRVVACALPTDTDDVMWDYAQAMTHLLGARISRLDTVAEMDALVAGEGARHDLVILSEPRHPLVTRLLARSTDRAPGSQPRSLPLAILAARRPRWPLGKILLVIWGHETDEVAVDWVVRLARPGGSAVTVLAVVPPAPAMYGGRARMNQGLPVLLASDTALGRQMSQAAQHLVDWEIEGKLKLRQGPPDWQIRRELAEGNYDLIALAAKPRSGWLRWLEGDQIGSILGWTDRPVLVAKPTSA
jgi:nucleotide-binding universal stress UspA family protein